jgi:hypothetical protein
MHHRWGWARAVKKFQKATNTLLPVFVFRNVVYRRGAEECGCHASGHGRTSERAIEMKHTVMNHGSKSYGGIEIMGMICEQGSNYNT